MSNPYPKKYTGLSEDTFEIVGGQASCPFTERISLSNLTLRLMLFKRQEQALALLK